MPAEERDGMKASGTHKVLLVLAFCLTVFLLCAPAGAADVVASGECGAEGSSVSWTLDSAGLLTISGTGAMEDYTYSRHCTPGGCCPNWRLRFFILREPD